MKEGGLLAAGSLVRFWDGSWTPRSWAGGCGWTCPCCHRTLGMGALWGQKQPLGAFFPAIILRFCIFCSAGIAGLGLLGGEVPPGTGSIPKPGQWVLNLSHCGGVPDSHPPCGESRLPRNPPSSWDRDMAGAWNGVGTGTRGGGGLPWGQTVAQRHQQRTDTSKPFCTPSGRWREGDGPVVPPRRKNRDLGMLWGSIPPNRGVPAAHQGLFLILFSPCRWCRPNLHDLEGVAAGTLAGRTTTAAGPAARSGLPGSLSERFASFLLSFLFLSLSLSPVLIS